MITAWYVVVARKEMQTETLRSHFQGLEALHRSCPPQPSGTPAQSQSDYLCAQVAGSWVCGQGTRSNGISCPSNIACIPWFVFRASHLMPEPSLGPRNPSSAPLSLQAWPQEGAMGFGVLSGGDAKDAKEPSPAPQQALETPSLPRPHIRQGPGHRVAVVGERPEPA